MTTTTECRFNATSRDECPRPVACNVHNDCEMRRLEIIVFTEDTLAATWEMRLLFPYETDSEFAQRLTSLGVADADAQVRAARFDAYDKRPAPIDHARF